jgi:hypothetical protein
LEAKFKYRNDLSKLSAITSIPASNVADPDPVPF